MLIEVFYAKNETFFVRKENQISQYAKNESGAYKRIQFQDFMQVEDTILAYNNLKSHLEVKNNV